MDHNALRARVAELLASGRLPTVRPASVLASYGGGLSCDLCGVPIGTTQVQYEMQADPMTGREIRLHWSCHQLWSDLLDDISG